MPTQCSRDLFGYEVVEGRQVVAAFDGGEVTSDAGALLLGATDRAIGLVTRFAACFDDGRAPGAGRAHDRGHGGAAGVRHRARLRGPDRPRPAAPRPGAGDARRQARGQAQGLRPARRQEHAQPARARAVGPAPLPQDRPRRRGDRAPVRRPLPRGAQDAARARSSSTSTPPTTRCTAIRKAASSTATTTATATCRCTCSAAGTCSRPSSGARTSMPQPAPSRRWRGSSPRSGRAGRGSRSCCGPTSGFARDELMTLVRGQPGRLRLRARPQRAPGRRDRRRSRRWPRPRAWPRAAPRAASPTSPGARSTAGAASGAWSPRPSTCPRAPNPRFVVTSLAGRRDRRPHPLRGRLLRPRRGREPDQGAAARSVRRSHVGGDHARQPAPAVVRVLRLRPARGAPADRPPAHPVRRRHLRHHPAQALEDRRPGPHSACAGSRSPWPRPARTRPSTTSPIST